MGSPKKLPVLLGERFTITVLVLAAIAVFAAAPARGDFVYQTLDVPGATSSAAGGISGRNIVGAFIDPGGASHGFFYDGSSFTTLDVPAGLGSNTVARAISGSDVGGYYTDALGIFHAFIYNGSTYTAPIDNPNAGSSAGQGTRIFGMDGGMFVGDFLHPTGLEQGYSSNGSTFTTISPGPNVQSAAFGIQGNKIVGVSAQVVGANHVLHGMIYDGTNYTELNDPNGGSGDGQGTELFGLDGNNIVGIYIDSSGYHGFLYDGSAFTDVTYPGSKSTVPLFISGNRIVGRYTDTGGQLHGFIATIAQPVAVGAAKLGGNGSPASISGAIVTRAFSGFFYIATNDRASGLRVVSSADVTSGQQVDVAGTMATNSSGERYLNANSVTVTGSGSVNPLGISNAALGGAGWQYNPVTGGGQQGVVGGVGLNNIGLLVTTWGVVQAGDTSASPVWFTIDDGSGVVPFVSVPGSGALPSVGSFVTVTGISSCYNSGGMILPELLVSSTADITAP